MTSEVVVMNRAGVALAADSAVTLEMGDSTKVRDSALKLFTLSKYRPVGVMIYNNASLLGVPTETIIKLFRGKQRREGFDTLGEYGEALIRFLDGNTSLFPEAVQNRYFLRALEMEYRRIGEWVEDEFVARGLYGKEEGALGEDRTDAVDGVIEERLKFWLRQEDAEYFKGVCAKDVVERISGGVHEVVNRVFLGWPVGGEAVKNLHEIARHLISKDYFPPDVLSGLVIAGFGEKEHFPAVQHLQIGGLYGDRLKVRPASLVKVSDENPSDIMAFAYKDMVDAFLYGISPSVVDHLADAAAFITEMPPMALNAVAGLAPEEKEKAAEKIRQESAAKAAEFAQNVLEGSETRRANIARAVDALTIKELAQVASTLVGLSSFEQQMSLDRETVGGPVDVAVISKGDGFIWIDRKHYFRRELNEHFFRNYYDGSAPMGDDAANGDEEEVQDDK